MYYFLQLPKGFREVNASKTDRFDKESGMIFIYMCMFKKKFRYEREIDIRRSGLHVKLIDLI